MSSAASPSHGSPSAEYEDTTATKLDDKQVNASTLKDTAPKQTQSENYSDDDDDVPDYSSWNFGSLAPTIRAYNNDNRYHQMTETMVSATGASPAMQKASDIAIASAIQADDDDSDVEEDVPDYSKWTFESNSYQKSPVAEVKPSYATSSSAPAAQQSDKVAPGPYKVERRSGDQQFDFISGLTEKLLQNLYKRKSESPIYDQFADSESDEDEEDLYLSFDEWKKKHRKAFKPGYSASYSKKKQAGTESFMTATYSQRKASQAYNQALENAFVIQRVPPQLTYQEHYKLVRASLFF